MPHVASLDPTGFFGGGTPALSGPGTIGDGYFCIFSKKEQSGDDAPSEGKGNQKSPKVYGVFPVKMDDGVETELRFSVAYATSRDGKRQWWPGEDAETFATAKDKDTGPRGPFLLWDDESGKERPLSEEYDRFPTFMKKLMEAGVPIEVFREKYPAEGLPAFSGIRVDFTHEIPEWEREDGTKVKGQPFNYPLPGSAVMPGAKGAKASTKGGSKAAAAPKQTKAEAAADVDEAVSNLEAAVIEHIMEQVGAGEEVTLEQASRVVTQINKDKELGVPVNKLMTVTLAVKGAGKPGEAFKEKLGEFGLSVTSAGVVSLAG